MLTTELNRLSDAVRKAIGNRPLLGHANRMDASWLNLYLIGAIPPFSAFYTAAQGTAPNDMSHQIYSLETSGIHGDTMWGYDPHWEGLAQFLSTTSDVVFMCAYRKPRHEAIIGERSDVLLTTPPVSIAGMFEDKSRLDSILTVAGVENRIPSIIYQHVSEMPSYPEACSLLGATKLILQVVASAGGARHDLKSSVSVIQSDQEYEDARAFQSGFGAVKLAVFVEGQESNGAAVVTRHGQVYVDLPSRKPVGITSLRGRPGSGSGNDWTNLFPPYQMKVYLETMIRIGTYMHSCGYYGFFGVDMIFPSNSMLPPLPHEINARPQGTTANQEVADLKVGECSLPLLALASDLDVNPAYFPDVIQYNQRSLARTGGGYLKYNVPWDMVIPIELNGIWHVTELGHLVSHRNGSALLALPGEIAISGAPKAGNTAKAGTALPTLYADVGDNVSLFTKEGHLTNDACRIIEAIDRALGLSEGD